MSTSQRRRGFNGGIQNGTTATTEESHKLDRGLRSAALLVMEQLRDEYPLLHYQTRLPAKEIGGGGCEPDGGLWFYDGELIMAAEAKHQGHGGNAIERWSKNFDIVRKVGNRASYLTFTTGAGVLTGGAIDKYFRQRFWVYDREPIFDTIFPTHMSVFRSEHGFEMDRIVAVMVDCIVQTIQAIDD